MSNLRILVVDDSPMILKAVRRILGANGHTVFTLSGAQSALSYLECTEIGVDVILCDEDMPQMTGMQFLKKLREKNDPYANRFIFHTDRMGKGGLGYSSRYKGEVAVSRKGDYDAIMRAIKELLTPTTEVIQTNKGETNDANRAS